MIDRKSIEVGKRHREVFGSVPPERLLAKLGEETGELIGAGIRQIEKRDGRDDWTKEIKKEMSDVINVLHAICYRFNISFSEAEKSGINKFLTKEWDVHKP